MRKVRRVRRFDRGALVYFFSFSETLSVPPGPLVLAGSAIYPPVTHERSLLDVLGHRPACVGGLCGACRVLVDGEIVNACKTLSKDVRAGAVILSYEDVVDDPAAKEAVRAFLDARPTRCALCVPSLGVTAVALARKGQSGDEDAVDAALETAACMCTGRRSLRAALLSIGKKT